MSSGMDESFAKVCRALSRLVYQRRHEGMAIDRDEPSPSRLENIDLSEPKPKSLN
jgi:hypothetical protein